MKIADWVLGFIAVLVFVGMVFGAGYLFGRGGVVRELGELAGKVEQQQREAGERLEKLTAERDEKQARLDRQAKDQEKKDADAKSEIDRLAGELERRPFRVRVVTGACSGGAAGAAAGATEDRAGDSSPAYGVLPPENTRRLDAALIEVETLSAAYSSCRARLFPMESNH